MISNYVLNAVFYRISLILIMCLAFSLLSVSAQTQTDTGATSDDNVNNANLLMKLAQINKSGANSSEEVLGWSYIFRYNNGSCYSYNESLSKHNKTEIVLTTCPTNLQVIDHYNVSSSEAINIMQRNLGGTPTLVEMALFWLMSKQSAEPVWLINTSSNKTILIGADSGNYSETTPSPYEPRSKYGIISYPLCFYSCFSGCLSELGENNGNTVDSCGANCGDQCDVSHIDITW